MNYRFNSILLSIFIMEFGRGHFQKSSRSNSFKEVPMNSTIENIAKSSLKQLRQHLGLNYTCELNLDHILSAQLSYTQGKTYMFDLIISSTGNCKNSKKFCRNISIYIPRKCYKSVEICNELIGKDRIMCTSFDTHFLSPKTNSIQAKNTFYLPDTDELQYLISNSIKFLYHYFSTSRVCPMELKKVSNMTVKRDGGTYYKFNLDLETIQWKRGCKYEYRRCENVQIFKPNNEHCKSLYYDCLFPLDAEKVNCSSISF